LYSLAVLKATNEREEKGPGWGYRREREEERDNLTVKPNSVLVGKAILTLPT